MYAIESANSEMQLAEVPVVNEFFDVFPEDLLGLPPIERLNSRLS